MEKVIITWPCLKNFTNPPHYGKNPPETTSPPLNPGITKQVNHSKSSTEPAVIPRKDPIAVQNISKQSINPPQTTQKQTKTFAQAVTHLCDIPSSQLPQPILKGDNFSTTIPEDEYLAGMDTCKHNLHARVIWPKGSTPLTTFALRNKLTLMWKDLQ